MMPFEKLRQTGRTQRMFETIIEDIRNQKVNRSISILAPNYDTAILLRHRFVKLATERGLNIVPTAHEDQIRVLNDDMGVHVIDFCAGWWYGDSTIYADHSYFEDGLARMTKFLHWMPQDEYEATLDEMKRLRRVQSKDSK